MQSKFTVGNHLKNKIGPYIKENILIKESDTNYRTLFVDLFNDQVVLDQVFCPPERNKFLPFNDELNEPPVLQTWALQNSINLNN